MNPIIKHIREAFRAERVICRAIACYFACAAFRTAGINDEFWKLAFGQDGSLMRLLLSCVFVFLLFSLLAVVCGERLHTDSWCLLLCGGLSAALWLLRYGGDDRFLFALSVIAVLTLMSVYFVRTNLSLFQSCKPNRALAVTLIAAAGICSFSVIAAIGCLRYATFSSPNFDFGIFTNMFYNMRETGQPLVSCERDRILSHFAVHISPVYYLLLPFYCIFPSPLTLQIGQAAVLALGIIPVALLCRRFALSQKVTVLVCALYACYPALSAGTFYDLHENCFLTPLLLFTFLFWEKQKFIPMYISALLVLSVKEDAAVYLLVFALFVLISERRPLHGLMLAALAVGYFLLAVHALEVNGTGTLNNRFYNLIYESEDGLAGAAKTALLNPAYILTQLFTTAKGGWEKVLFFLQMLLPLGFLPFCTKKASRWLLITPILVSMVSYYQYLYDIGFQYQFATTAFLFYAVIKTLPELTPPTRRNLLSFAAVACCCLYLVTVIPKLSTYTNRMQSNRATYEAMEQFLDTVPSDASVVCSSFLLAHIADREEIYELNYHDNKPDVDYVVLDARDKKHITYQNAYLKQNYALDSELPGLIVILKKQ